MHGFFNNAKVRALKEGVGHQGIPETTASNQAIIFNECDAIFQPAAIS